LIAKAQGELKEYSRLACAATAKEPLIAKAQGELKEYSWFACAATA
ncbi:hypothetical protein W672_01224, partial [Staphylococcus aureus VET0460R]